MVEHDEELGPVPGDGLDGGAGDDLTDADTSGLGRALSERITHGGGEVPLELGAAEGEDPLPVGLDLPVVEGRGGDGEVVGDVDGGLGGRGEPLGVVVVDEEEDAPADQNGEDEADDRGRQSGREEAAHGARVSRLWFLAPVLAVAAIVVGVLLLVEDPPAPSEVERRDAALDVSREFAVALASHDHENLDASFDAVRRLSTGSFLDEFDRTFASPELRAALEDAESRAEAEIVTGPLLADLDGSRARTFTVVRQRVATAEEPEPVERVVRVELLMVDTDEGWRVDAVEVT